MAIRIATDKYGRRVYKGSHSVFGGGFHFALKTKDFKPLLVGETKEKLHKALLEAFDTIEHADLTIRIFPSHFHIFVFFRISMNEVLNKIYHALEKLGEEIALSDIWHPDCMFVTVDDITEESVNKMLNRLKT